jgi:hypothetical protein
MTRSSKDGNFDRYSEIGVLCRTMRTGIKRGIVPMGLLLAGETAYLWERGVPGTAAFALMSASSCVALLGWSQCAIGLPLLPLIILQGLMIYGVPIMASHENILMFPSSFVLQAGFEVMIFNLSMLMAWWIGMRLLRPALPVSYALHEFNKLGAKGWARLGFGMIICSTAFEIAQTTPLLDGVYALLPSGSDSILNALPSVASACGFFLVSMVIGGREASAVEKSLFWSLLIVNSLVSASSFLLAGVAANLATVAIGLFWSNGRVPWRYIVISTVSLSFLNVGKVTMRARYWASEESAGTTVSFIELPACFIEWSEVSFNATMENDAGTPELLKDANPDTGKNQTLLDRIDNLQNLLFVIDAIEANHIKPLGGATYSIIPPLLVPRILWPNKPRSHEGQVLLNVHFGRQDLESTFKTYIAWGLLPEAYGNYGAIFGSLYLGVALGMFFAWVENYTARKLLVSMEGFLSLSLFMNLLNSFEMVASVFVTSTFQSFMIIAAASAPFVHRSVGKKQQPENN